MQPALPVQATSPARIEVALTDKPDRLDGGFAGCDAILGHTGNQEILPHREADIAVAEFGGDLGEAAHLIGGELADRQHDADPAKSVLLLRMCADMRQAVECGTRRDGFSGDAHELAAELFLHRGEEFLKAPGVEHIFEARLGAIGAIAVVDEDAHDRVRDLGRLVGFDDDAGVARKVLMAGDAAKHEAEPDARLDAEALLHVDGLETDVVGVFQHRDHAGAVEADVELARNAEERTVVEDVEMPCARIRPRIDQLLRIDAGGRRAGDVADIVGAGAARAQAEILDRLDHGHGVLRLDLAHLQIGARRHMA